MTQPNPQVDLNQIINGAIAAQISNPQVVGGLTAIAMRQIGNVLREASYGGVMNAGAFLTQMRRLPDGASLGLLNEWIVQPNAWRVLAYTQADGSTDLFVFRPNEAELDHSVITDLKDNELGVAQREELLRQLAVIGHQGARLYTAIIVPNAIEGYEYFLTDVEKAAAGEANGAATLGDAAAKTATTPALAESTSVGDLGFAPAPASPANGGAVNVSEAAAQVAAPQTAPAAGPSA